MNKIIACKCVVNIHVIRIANSRITSNQHTQKELRHILDVASKELNFTHLNDWYKLPTKDYRKLLERFDEKENNANPFLLLSSAYPEHDWLPWKFEQCPRGYWNDARNVRKFMDWAGKQLSVTDMSDWYKTSYTDFVNIGGGHLLQLKSSHIDLLHEAYPEYDWLPWKFEQCPRGYWDDIKNVHKFMDWAAKQLNIKEMSDWYKVSFTDLSKIGGRQLLLSKSSYFQLLTEVYPNYDWLPWKFEQCPRGYWNDPKNVRKFMDWAAKQLDIKEMSDWYKITATDFINIGGRYLLRTKPSYIDLITESYPDYDWYPWMFEQCPYGYWNDIKNVRKYMDWAGKQLNVKEMSDWYDVSRLELTNMRGSTMLEMRSSYIDIFPEVYPEYDWLPWKFSAFSSKSLVTNANRKLHYVKWLANQLNIKEMSDWYKIKAEQIIDLRGGILIIENKSLPKLLSQAYSEYQWDYSRFEHHQPDIWVDCHLANYFVEWLKTQSDKEISVICEYAKEIKPNVEILTKSLQLAFPRKWAIDSSQNTKKSQYMLKECIQNIFRDRNNNPLIMEEYRHPDAVNLELDYFLPEYKIAFEFQGKQHYKTVGFHNRKESIETVRERDRNKLESCKELGISLIEVPHWWDRKTSSLAATIYNIRPDLFGEKPQEKPIPSSPPQRQLTDSQKTTSKKALMTATLWDNDTMEPNGWYLTEKYDGIRFYWDGTQCFSRQGNKINVPASLAKQLPSVELDGELWTQYGLHQEAVALMSTNKVDKWNRAIFWIFDAPKLNKPIEERIEFLQQLKLPSFAKVVEFVKCEGKEHLKQFNDSIIAKGGEGVILREPASLYKPERSTSLRKFKPYFDAEVRVLKNQYPYGFICEQHNGKSVFVKIENTEHAKSIKKGAIITVKHSGTNAHGTLLFPQFYRERLDIAWDDLAEKTM